MALSPMAVWVHRYCWFLRGAVCKNIISDRFGTKSAISAHI